MNLMPATITDQNFNDRFTAYFRTNPRDWRIIRQAGAPKQIGSIDLNEDQGDAWFRYLLNKGMVIRYKTWRSIVAIGRPVMVPCERPETFDLAYVPSHKLERL